MGIWTPRFSFPWVDAWAGAYSGWIYVSKMGCHGVMLLLVHVGLRWVDASRMNDVQSFHNVYSSNFSKCSTQSQYLHKNHSK